MIATSTTPWTFHLHALSWIALGAAALTAVALGRHLSNTGEGTPTPLKRRQAVLLVSGYACLVVALTWPVADLAQSYSLLARIGQNLLLSLAAPGLILAGLPAWMATRLTRPVVVHSAIRQLTRPPVAVLIFNAAVIGAQLPPAVRATSQSSALHGGVDVLLLVAGLILWTPVVRIVPGARPFSTAGRAGYLFAQSFFPNFVSLVYIFARRPFYPVYAHGARLLGLSPLLDQQLAGVLAKIVGVFVLWGAAIVVLMRTSRAEEAGLDPAPLTWEDVDRELRRLDRRHRRVDQDS